MQEIERAVERVIEHINEHFGEELTIDDMARTAMYSKFHFTRIFQRVTGLTPGRFLSAVRLREAKQLLTTTSMTVTEISHRVGYTSVGTFSSRFGHSVGVPPTTYRQLGGFRPAASVEEYRSGGPTADTRSMLRGNVSLSSDRQVAGIIFIGLFPGPIHQGHPVRHTVLDHPGPYVLEQVPQGTWYVMACSETREPSGAAPSSVREFESAGRRPRFHQHLLVGSHGPIVVKSGTSRRADLRLRPMGVLDPPVLLALPGRRAVASNARGNAAA